MDAFFSDSFVRLDAGSEDLHGFRPSRQHDSEVDPSRLDSGMVHI